MFLRRSCFSLPLALSAIFALSACNVQRTGADVRLDMKAEPEYRKSLAVAWKDMTPEQRDAYNWAVDDMTLYGLMAAHPEATPRDVITKEADKYIAAQIAKLAKAQAAYASARPQLDAQEQRAAEVTAELRKITAGNARLDHGNRQLTYTVTNNSRYDISDARWTAWVYVNGEQRTTKSVRFTSNYGTAINGLRRGASAQMRVSVYDSDMHTAEIRTAQKVLIQMEVDPASVTDLGERRIVPTFEANRGDHTRTIDQLKESIAHAAKQKASVDRVEAK